MFMNRPIQTCKMASWHPAMPSCFSHQAKVESLVYVSSSLFLRGCLLQFTTSNCRSLTSKIKLEQLGVNRNSYGIDFLALQDIRMVAGSHPIKVPYTNAMFVHPLRMAGLHSGEKITTVVQHTGMIVHLISRFCKLTPTRESFFLHFLMLRRNFYKFHV